MLEQHTQMLHDDSFNKRIKSGKGKNTTSPLLRTIKNFALAKKLHKENLEHQPLPDTVTNAMYRKLQLEGNIEPGLALDESFFATGVGYKDYLGYAPTKCTKLKVFRPKTALNDKIVNTKCGRPTSVDNFDRKWRFIRQQKVTPIQLAVYWDLTPMNPLDEPKRTTHIDGSNGSMAPAVFTLVHTPKEDECEENGCGSESTSTGQVVRSVKPSSSIDDGLKKRAQSAYNLQEGSINRNSSNSSQAKLHQSTPNLTKYCSQECKEYKLPNARLCVACEMRNVKIKDTRPKSEYKMAFKAGVPQRKPNDKRQDYPEHWRLASVYQHSYKPIQNRKRTLLNTIFK